MAMEAIKIWLGRTVFFFQRQLILETKQNTVIKTQELAKNGLDVFQLSQMVPPPL